MVSPISPKSVGVVVCIKVFRINSKDRVEFKTFQSIFNILKQQRLSVGITFLRSRFESIFSNIRDCEFAGILSIPFSESEHSHQVKMNECPHRKHLTLDHIVLPIISHDVASVPLKFLENLIGVSYGKIGRLPHRLNARGCCHIIKTMLQPNLEGIAFHSVITHGRQFICVKGEIPSVAVRGSH